MTWFWSAILIWIFTHLRYVSKQVNNPREHCSLNFSGNVKVPNKSLVLMIYQMIYMIVLITCSFIKRKEKKYFQRKKCNFVVKNPTVFWKVFFSSIYENFLTKLLITVKVSPLRQIIYMVLLLLALSGIGPMR